MLLLFLCLLFCCISNGEYNIRCGSEDGFSFVESRDGVHGRYRLEWCTQVNKLVRQSAGQWIVSINYNPEWESEDCHQNKSEDRGPGENHSYFKEDVRINLNCTNVCLSTNFDLIFNGSCYRIGTHLRTNKNSSEVIRFGEHHYYKYVQNNYTKDNFAESEAVLKSYISGEHVNAHWYLNLVPATVYTMYLCPETESECTEVTKNCSTVSPTQTQIQCELWPPAERYRLQLKHMAPWTTAVKLFGKISSVESLYSQSLFVEAAAPPAVTQPASAALWWALGGTLALALCGGALLLACHSHLAAKLRKRVQFDWRRRLETEVVARPGGGRRRILLLYARDCAPMMTVAAQLRTLLQRSADHVYDLYSADVVREAARAPGEWLRRVVARVDVRVVLLQSPAAACLHAPALRERGAPPANLTLEQPLLNRHVMYRAPHSSDSLLLLALRLLTDTAHTTHSYKKFYIATISGLEAELVREVTPLRRYSLPAAAKLLLRDLCDGALTLDVDLEAHIQRFSKAVQDLHEHVRANPDYLDEELIFFDYD